MLIPYSHSPIITACGPKAIVRLTQDVPLLVACDLAGITGSVGIDRAVVCEITLGGRNYDPICGLYSILIALKSPKDADLVNVETNGFVKTVDAAARDFHGRGWWPRMIAEMRGICREATARERANQKDLSSCSPHAMAAC